MKYPEIKYISSFRLLRIYMEYGGYAIEKDLSEDHNDYGCNDYKYNYYERGVKTERL